MTRYLFIAILVLLCALWVSVRSCRDVRQERDRLSDNQSGLMEGINYYRTADSLSVASVERLTLTNKDFKKHCSDLQKTVESLNLKVKRLQSVSRTVTETKYQVKTVIKDSILPGKTDTLKCIDYRDAYLTLAGCDFGGEFIGKIESRDTLVQVVHRVPRRFWFIKFGCKAIRQEIVSKNPYAQITFTEYIEFRK